MKSRISARNRALSNAPPDQSIKFRRALGRNDGAVHGAPGHEAFETGGERAEARLNPVRGREHGVGAEERGDIVLVGLELVERSFEGGVLATGVLQLHDGERQAVDEQNHIRPAVVLSFDDRELVHREPVIGLDVVEVDQPHRIATDATVLPGTLHGHAFDQVAVEAAVLLDERGRLRLPQLAQRLLLRLGRQLRVEARHRLAEPASQQHLTMAGALRLWPLRADIRPVQHGIAQPGKPAERGVLHLGFGDDAHAAGAAKRFMTRRIIRSLLAGALSAISKVSAVNAPGVEPAPDALLLHVEQEQESADALVAVGERVVLHDEIKQMRRLFLAAPIERFTEHGLLEVAENGLERIAARIARTAPWPRLAPQGPV